MLTLQAYQWVREICYSLPDKAFLEDGSFCFAGTSVVVMVVTNRFVHFNVDVVLVAGKT